MLGKNAQHIIQHEMFSIQFSIFDMHKMVIVKYYFKNCLHILLSSVLSAQIRSVTKLNIHHTTLSSRCEAQHV